jgi:predicted dehydrogenase
VNRILHRRDFLKSVGAAGAGLGAGLGILRAGTFPERAAGANARIRTAVIGTNSRGLALAECLTGLADVEVAYICDVDDRAIAKGIEAVRKRQKASPRGLKDFRRALEDKSLDAVAIATPDHWHAPMSILALAAGKHVYVEKPCSHNAREGELLIQAVRQSGRVLQMGAQRRSFPNMQRAVAEIHGGVIGRAYAAKAWYANKRASIGRGRPAPVPGWLDYDLWQGPAPRRPYRDNLIHYNWHWFWHWGTGEALNNGTHEVDVCRWALGLDWPERVVSEGGRYHFEDDWETPDTQTIGWDFAEKKSIFWESRSCNDFPVEGLSRGSLIFGTEGTVLLDGNSYSVFDGDHKLVRAVKGGAETDRTNPLSATGLDLDQLHVADFVDAIRTGRPPTCAVEDAHKSVAMLHLGNIAWRTGRALSCDRDSGRIKNDAAAMALWGRSYEPGWEPAV